VGNAVKFTDRGSVSVTVAMRPPADAAPARLRFEVVDTGIGVAPEIGKHLFEKFNQGDTSITRRFGGSGLGLAICKQLVELMGGEIGVDRAARRGSCFWFEIALPRALARVTGSSSPRHIHGVHSPMLQPPSTAQSISVLVAEDNRINQHLAATLLRNAGHRATVVENGRQAVDEVGRGGYDIVLMDVQMPVLDGIQATKQIRSLPEPLSQVRII